MPAWSRVNPVVLTGLSKTTWHRKSGHMLMATAAKKHLTIFYRKREAIGAGRPEVKDAFAKAAESTRDEPFREKRNALIRQLMLEKNIGTGVYRRKSRGKFRLYGTEYVVKLDYKPGKKIKPPTNFAHVAVEQVKGKVEGAKVPAMVAEKIAAGKL
jgi:hypothetical protein